MSVPEKLAALRTQLRQHKLAAYLIPSGDPHQSEYVAAHWKTREWLSGFSGSAGTVVVTAEHAGLWTDSRYFLQAEQQLAGSGIKLHKLNIPHTPEHLDWLKENLPHGSKLGLDGRLFSVASVRKLAKALYEKDIGLDTTADLPGLIWQDRPPLPKNPVFEHDLKYAGKSRAEKLHAVREKMGQATFLFVPALDDIAWLYNLRGSDMECNPVFYAYAVVGKQAAYLFIEETKVGEALKHALNADGILLKPYDSIGDFLKNLSENETILLDLATINHQLYSAIPEKNIVEGENIVARLKTIKNPVEIEHIRHAMCKDGAVLVRLFRWLEKTLPQRPVLEAEVAEKLIELRREQPGYFGESFDAIVGYDANGAIVHYRPERDTCASIYPEGILLLDCGGQYLDGTTDITRTIALGTPTAEQKRDFTLVLKGHIALAKATFPYGTTGVQLDTLARMYLWGYHLNYGHGTGHGVGFFNNVHEGPQGFSPVPSTPRASIAIEPGMLTSNEPGLYKTGEYGIRIENLVLCVEDGENGPFGKFYRFDTLSLFPIDLNLVEESLLSDDEKRWLNNYHQHVFEKIAPLLSEEEAKWLEMKTGRL